MQVIATFRNVHSKIDSTPLTPYTLEVLTATMPFLLNVLHATQACLSAYALYLSYMSITDSQKYEEKTEKAAQYSNTAEQQLHKTRTTLASGTAAVSLRTLLVFDTLLPLSLPVR